jgi:hypothetical protein
MIDKYNKIKQLEMCEPNYLQEYVLVLTWKHEARYDTNHFGPLITKGEMETCMWQGT